MPRALEGFVAFDCDDDLAGRLGTEVALAQGVGYDLFEFDTFDVESFYAEDRVAIREAAELGYDRPRRVIIPPPPAD